MLDRSTAPPANVNADLDGFALKALSVLAKELRMAGELKEPGPEFFIQELYHAVSSRDPARAPEIISKMLEIGLKADEIAGKLIPEVARRLGEAWCEDNLDFAVVTIGSARLQGLLRNLGPEWCAEEMYSDPDAPRCMVIVPDACQHTLGASILTGQLRRAGVSVSLNISKTTEVLRETIARTPTDAVLISASARESLDVIRRIVQKLKQSGRNVPVVIGGNVLAQEIDVARVTGADLATSELDEAIRFCGFDVRFGASATGGL